MRGEAEHTRKSYKQSSAEGNDAHFQVRENPCERNPSESRDRNRCSTMEEEKSSDSEPRCLAVLSVRYLLSWVAASSKHSCCGGTCFQDSASITMFSASSRPKPYKWLTNTRTRTHRLERLQRLFVGVSRCSDNCISLTYNKLSALRFR